MPKDMVIKKVERGDCAWTVAKRNLKAQNKSAKNADIVKEMKRLANINGCKDANDFNKKCFSSVNNYYAVEEKKPVVNKDSTPKKPDNTKQQGVTTNPADKTNDTKKNPPLETEKSNNPGIDKINKMTSDEKRIIQYNKTNYKGEHYGIVDKKACKLNIYDKQGKIVKSFTVGVGKTIGDNIGSYFLDGGKKAETQRYTTAGEFTLDEYNSGIDDYKGKDGKTKIMALRGDNMGVRGGQMCIHMCYKPEYIQRAKKIKSKTLVDNRMSYGCVNLLEEDYDKMHKYLGEGDKIYVLPEESGNKLKLNKQKDGTYKFEQIYHKNDLRGKTKEEASNVNYDVRPERNPENIV